MIDFSHYQQGQKLYLVNRLRMSDLGFGPEAIFDEQDKFLEYVTVDQADADRIVCFEVGGDAPDPSRPLGKLRNKPGLPQFTKLAPNELKALGNHRCFEFSMDDTGTWVVNGRPFDPSPAGATHRNDNAATLLPVGTLMTPRIRLSGEDSHDGEVWTIKNATPSGWAHPVHIHLEEFQILWRDGRPPRPHENVKKDVLTLAPNRGSADLSTFPGLPGKVSNPLPQRPARGP